MEYPEHERSIRMLKILFQEAQDAHRLGEEKLWLDFVRGDDGKPRLTVSGTEVDVAREAGLEGAEALALLEKLCDTGYIGLDLDEYGFSAGVGLVGVTLLDKGVIAIGELPDPKEELLSSLDAIAAAIEGLQDVSLNEKRLGRKVVEELKTFARTISPAAAREIVKAIAVGASRQ